MHRQLPDADFRGKILSGVPTRTGCRETPK